MLGVVYDMIAKAYGLNLDSAWHYGVIENNQIPILIKEWIKEQLDEGVNSDNEIIGLYSVATEQITNGRKKAGTPYNLEETGVFRQSIVVVPDMLQIKVYANGQKMDEDILDKYSLRVIGLLEENKEKLREIILEEFLKYVKGTLYQS